MSDLSHCPKCGAKLAPGVLGSACPNCMLQAAFDVREPEITKKMQIGRYKAMIATRENQACPILLFLLRELRASVVRLVLVPRRPFPFQNPTPRDINTQTP